MPTQFATHRPLDLTALLLFMTPAHTTEQMPMSAIFSRNTHYYCQVFLCDAPFKGIFFLSIRWILGLYNFSINSHPRSQTLSSPSGTTSLYFASEFTVQC
jgi:hypothetical protein